MTASWHVSVGRDRQVGLLSTHKKHSDLWFNVSNAASATIWGVYWIPAVL
jgi:hypothetical protein